MPALSMRLSLTLCAALLISTPAYAQVAPSVAPELLEPGRRVDGTITLCSNPEPLSARMDQALADAIADYLLADVTLKQIRSPFKIDALAYGANLSLDDLYIYLHNDCDAVFGAVLGVGVPSTWATYTIPYLEARFVALTTKQEIDRVDTMPEGTRVGTRSLSQVDLDFAMFAGVQKGLLFPRRMFFATDSMLLDQLAGGGIDIALTWEGAALAYGNETFRQIDMGGFRANNVSLSLMLSNTDVYLRQSLDQALTAMATDGVLEEIAIAAGLKLKQ